MSEVRKLRVIVIGTGYVGLVTGTCFADIGHRVTCVDINEHKIAALLQGIIPIYEPGLDELVKNNVETGRLSFSTNLKEVLHEAEVVFIAVGTPSNDEGAADLSYVFSAAKEIGEHLSHDCVIVNKSTVPVGTAEAVQAIIQDELSKRHLHIKFSVVSNPEFLKEGKAIEDFMMPDRIVVGAENEYAKVLMVNLYKPLNGAQDKLMIMSRRDAEMTKYVANAMLATRISFMNEIATLCDAWHVDVEQVRQGIGSDVRIGPHFLLSGCGYGGSCFPKDVKALIHMAHEMNIDPIVLNSVDKRNDLQKRILFEKLIAVFNGDLQDKTIALWGLAFKPETDDLREASSQVFIEEALSHGAIIRAYDPVAMTAAKEHFPKAWFKSLTLMESAEETLMGADALVIATEWSVFRKADLDAIKKAMHGNRVIDGRNIFDPAKAKSAGLNYVGVGRK